MEGLVEADRVFCSWQDSKENDAESRNTANAKAVKLPENRAALTRSGSPRRAESKYSSFGQLNLMTFSFKTYSALRVALPAGREDR